MTKPLTHSGDTASQLLALNADIIGTLVYAWGKPQVIGIIRQVKKRGSFSWDSEVEVEWQSGTKVWKRATSVQSIDSKIKEDERALTAFKIARDNAIKHFEG